MTVADRMAVFMDGRIIQVGTPKGIYLQPANVAVAAFIGTPPMNLLPARLESGSVAVAGATLPVAHDHAAARGVILGVRPGALVIGQADIPATEPGTAAGRERVRRYGLIPGDEEEI